MMFAHSRRLLKKIAVGTLLTLVAQVASFTAAVAPAAALAAPAPQTQAVGDQLDRMPPVDAATQAALDKLTPAGPGEVVALRKANSRTFRTAKGYQVELHAGNIQYEAQPGVFDTIDSTLVPITDGGKYQFQNKANGWLVRFTDSEGANQMRIDDQGRWFTLDLDEEQGAGGRGFRTTVQGSGITYSAPGAPIKLRYQVGASEVKEEIVLDRFTGKDTWTYKLQTKGFVPAQRETGGIGLMYDSSQTEEAWELYPVFAQDAAGARMDGNLGFTPLADGTYQVTVSVDRQWLADPQRAYPVVIDPTAGSQVDDKGSMWSVIQSGSSTPYTGSLLEMRGDGNVRSLVKFDLRSLGSNIVTSNQLTSATIEAHINNPTSACSGYTSASDCYALWTAQPLAQDWFRSSATWSRPRWNGTSWTGGDVCDTTKCPGLPANAQSFATDIFTAPPAGSGEPPAIYLDVTNAIQRMLDGSQPNNGFLMTLTNDHRSQNDLYLWVKDGSGNSYYAPYLTLNFTADVTAPTVSITAPANGAVVQSPRGNPPGTVPVSVTAGDQVDGGATGYLSRVELLVDNNVVSSSPADAGSTFTFDFNPSQYVTGPHRLVARAYDRAGNHTDSAPVDVTVQGGLMAAPSNLTVQPQENHAYLLTWAPATGRWASPQDPSAKVTYTVQRSTTSDFSSFTVVDAGVAATNYTDTPGTGTYYYRVQAISDLDGGTTDFSNVATNQPPVAPAAVTATSLVNGSVRVAWQASPNAYLDSGISYKVYRSANGGASQPVNPSATGLDWTDSTAVSGTTYTYQVSAVNKASQESPLAAALPVTATTAVGPDAPTGVNAVNSRQGMVTVYWDAPGTTGITYNLYRSTDQHADPTRWEHVASGLGGWFYNDFGLTDGVTYYYQVEAVAAGQVGPRSQTAATMAVTGRRLGVDSRWPSTALPAGDGTAYLDLQNGNLTFTATDSTVAAPYLPVVVQRYYNSQGVPGGSLGDKWRLNADWKVEDYGSYAVLTTGDGGEHVYTFDGTSYHGDMLWYWTLAKDVSGNFVLSRPDRMQYQFNSVGLLASITERNGNTISYTYDAASRLKTITDPVNRPTALDYDPQGRLKSVTDGAGRVTSYAYDEGDRLIKVTNAENWSTTYSYDSHGRLALAVDPSGRWTALTYDLAGRVATVTDGLGNRTTLAYSTGTTGGTTDVTDAQQGKTTFGYNTSGLVTRLTDAEQNGKTSPKSWTYSYTYMASDPMKVQTTVAVNPQGLQTQLTYDAFGNVTQVVEQGTSPGMDLTAPGVTMRMTSMSYLDGSSDLSATTDPEGNSTIQHWSTTTPTRLLTIQNPLGGLVQYTYSDKASEPGWITAVTDANNNQTGYAYDGQGNVKTQSYVLSPTKTVIRNMTYYPDGSIKDITELHDPAVINSPATHTDYDQLGRKVRVQYPDGSQEAWIYDPAGNVALQVTRGSQRVTYQYDGDNRVVKAKDNAGGTVSYTYDDVNNTITVTDPNGHAGTTQYDHLHRVIRQEDPAGMVTRRSYDEMGNGLSTTTGDKNIVDTSGYTVTASYYLSGLLRQVNEPLPSGAVLLSDGTTPSGATTNNTQLFQYNKVGKQTLVTDGNGIGTTYTYDLLYRLTKVTDALGGATEYAYDANGNQTDVWDAQLNKASSAASTHMVYDALNRLTSTTDPLGNTTSQTYDDAGNLATRTEPRGVGAITATYGYDLAHNLTSVSYPNLTGNGPKSSTTYVYDGGGRRLFRSDEWGLARYSYDNLGRPKQVVSPQENTTYGYDAAGNLTSLGYSLGTVNYTYDQANRMTTVTDPLNNITSYSYDRYGHLSQTTLPGGMKRSDTYYTLSSGAETNRIQQISNVNSAGSVTYWFGAYRYDYAGNVRDINVTWNQSPSSYSLTATYDSLYRLMSWKDTSVSDSSLQTYYYRYDLDGNRTEWGNQNSNGQISYKTPGGTVVTQNASYNADNRVSSQSTAMRNAWQQMGSRSTGITQEPNGNASQDVYWYTGSTQPFDAIIGYKYDDANRMTQYNSEVHEYGNYWLDQEYYTYDGDGRRIDWTANLCVDPPGGTCYAQYVQYTYKQYEYVGNSVVAERGQDGNVPVWYVYGRGGEKLYTVHWDNSSNLTVDVYAKDHLDSIREVVKSTGETANWYNYDAFGLPTNQSVSLANSYQFASAPLDVSYRSSTDPYASFYNLNARLYNPQVGRFLTQDTYRGNPWQPWTQNLYVYSGNNPVNYVDPTGHSPTTASTAEGVGAEGVNERSEGNYYNCLMDYTNGRSVGMGCDWEFPGQFVSNETPLTPEEARYAAAANPVVVVGAASLAVGLTGDALSIMLAPEGSGGGGGAGVAMVGAQGTQVSSKTVWKDASTGRIDVENPAPGKRPGQLHFQDWSGGKWLYNGSEFVGAPKWVNDLLQDSAFRAKVDYGWQKMLGMQ